LSLVANDVANDLARNLINAGIHFGHALSRWNPKMKPYIYARRGMIHIINVRETLKGIILAKKLLSDVVASGKDIVFIGTKRQARKAIKSAAESTGMHYVTTRWLGGTLTNFRTIHSRIQRLEELESMANDGSIETESKKRASTLKRELRKIKSNLEGIRKLNQIPGAIVVVDARKEMLALREAKKMEVPTIALIDTDSDPDLVDVAVPGNDDSVKAIEIIIGELAVAVAEGKTMHKTVARDDELSRRSRGRRRSLARADKETPVPIADGAGQAVVEPQPPSQSQQTPQTSQD
jgi:small subunit ribosomal protein S2